MVAIRTYVPYCMMQNAKRSRRPEKKLFQFVLIYNAGIHMSFPKGINWTSNLSMRFHGTFAMISSQLLSPSAVELERKETEAFVALLE